MAYADAGDDILEDVINRKEFYALKNKHKHEQDASILPYFAVEDALKKGNNLQFHSYQKFVQNFMNPNTPYKRLLMKHSTGSGKTIGAIGIAMRFIKYFRQEEIIGTPKNKIGSVFVIAFDGAKKAFQKDLLRFPQFGFATRNELITWNSLKQRARSNIQSDIDIAYEYGSKIKKRISNNKGNGFFKFIGYKALVNNLFSPENISNLSEEEIINRVKSGKLKYNKNVMDSFKNSLIICDEIHNVYNSLQKNNWGIVLQIILDSDPSIRAVFMSATPINNNPSEIIDLLNLLLPKETRLKRQDYFYKKQIKPKSLEKLKKISRGYVSFLIDKNPKNFPSREFLGSPIKSIKYIKFNRCVLSGLHLSTYKHAIKEGSLPQDSKYIMDFVLPSPDQKTTKLGLYKSSDLRKIVLADSKWKQRNNIDVVNNVITGEFLNMSNLQNVSNKYYTMMKTIFKLLKNNEGKIFIYHNYVNMSGVVFIKEILLRNGIIDEYMGSTDNTLCSVCGIIRKKHVHDDELKTDTRAKIGDHKFKPTRFIIVHSEIDSTTSEKSIDKFNRASNAFGHDFKILLGSKKIKESYDLKAIRHVMITSRPDNIPTLIQILGRAVRKNSHVALPPDLSQVYVYIFTNTLPNELSYEELKYKEKMKDYELIQLIEQKIFHEGAVDSIINYSIVKSGLSKYDLGDLDFTPDLKDKKFTLSQLNLKTFNTYHKQQEVELVTYIIKRAFLETSPVWEYSDLSSFVKNPNFSVEYDTTLIDEENIIIALSALLWDDKSLVNDTPHIEDVDTKIRILDKLFDHVDKRFIFPNGTSGAITQTGKYYMLLPLDGNILRKYADMMYRAHTNRSFKYIKISDYLKSSANLFNYSKKKKHFKDKYENANIEQLHEAVCDYGVDFHIKFIEECISYIFLSWTDWSTDKSDYHDFYFRMLYYYDIIGLIVFADTSREFIFNKYEKYVLPSKFMKNRKETLQGLGTSKTQISEDREKHNLLSRIARNISKSSCEWCSQVTKEIYEKSLTKSLERFTLVKQHHDTKNIVKVSPDLLPIGHFLQKYPKFYHPERGWFSSPEYLINKNVWVENPIIIGYNVKSKTGIHVRFKIRTPIQNIKIHKDARLIEKGSICSTRSKSFLVSLCKKLNIPLSGKESILSICNEIKARLMYLELLERAKGSNIKFFYSHFESGY